MLYGIALMGKTYYNVRCFVMKKTYALENLDCANCARKMEEAIRRIDGVQDAQVNFLTQKMTVSAEEADFARHHETGGQGLPQGGTGLLDHPVKPGKGDRS